MAVTTDQLKIEVIIDDKGAKGKIKDVSGNIAKIGDSADMASKDVSALEKSMKLVGGSIVVVNQALELGRKAMAGLSTAFDGTIGKAISLEKNLAEVATLIDGDATKAVESLKEETLALQETFGGNQETIVKGFYQAISSGAVDASNATDLLTVAQKLAVGGVTTLDVAVDGLTNVINGYGLDVSEATDVSDALFIAMRNGKTTVAELSSNIGKVAPIASNLGIEFGELFASVSAITTGGVKTSEVMTQLKAAFTQLSRPGEDLQKVFDQLGITSIQAQIANEGFVGTLNKIIDQTDGSTEALSKLFGSVEAVQAIAAITSDTIGGSFVNTLAQIEEAALSSGEVSEAAFQKIADTADFRLNVAFGAADAAATRLGDAMKIVLAPAVELAADVFENVVESVNDFSIGLKRLDFENIKQALQTIATLAATAVAAFTFGSIQKQVAVAISSLGGLKKATIALGSTLGAAAKSLVLFTGGFASVEFIVKNQDKIVAAFNARLKFLSNAFLDAKISALEFKETFKDFLGLDTEGTTAAINETRKELIDGLAEEAELWDEVNSKQTDYSAFSTITSSFSDIQNAFNVEIEKTVDAQGKTIDKTKELIDVQTEALSTANAEELETVLSSITKETQSITNELDNLRIAQLDGADAAAAQLEKDKEIVTELQNQVRENDKLTDSQKQQALLQVDQLDTLIEQRVALEQNQDLLNTIADITKKAEKTQKDINTATMGRKEALMANYQVQLDSIEATRKQVQENETLNEQAKAGILEQLDTAKAATQQKLEIEVGNLPSDFQSSVEGATDGFSSSVGAAFLGPIGAIDAFINVAQGVVDAIPNLLNNAAGLLNSISDFPDVLGEAIDGFVEATIRFLAEGLPKLFEKLPAVIDKLIDAVPDIITALARSIPKLVPALVKLVPKVTFELIKAVPEIVKALFDEIPQLVPELVMMLLDELSNGAQTLFQKLGSLTASGIADGVKNAFKKAVELAKKGFENIVKFFKENFFAIFEKLGDVFRNIFDGFKNVGGKIWGGLKDAFNNAGSFFSDIGNSIWNGVTSAASGLGDFFKNLFKFDGGGTGAVEDFFGFDFPWFAFNQGGVVPGFSPVSGDSPKNDRVPALLSPGEVVLPRSVVKNEAYAGLIEAMLSGEGVSGMFLGGLAEKAGSFFTKGVSAASDVADDIIDTVADKGGDVVNAAGDVTGKIFETIEEVGADAIDFGSDLIKSVIPSDILDMYNSLKKFISDVDLKSLVTNPLAEIKRIIKDYGKDFLQSPLRKLIDNFVFGYEGGVVPGLAKVSGNSLANDTVPVMLSPGEVVIPRELMQKSSVQSMVSSIFSGEQFGTGFQMPDSMGMLSNSRSTMGSGDTYNSPNIQVTLNITSQNVTADTIRTKVVPEMMKQLKRESARGSFLIDQKGLRTA